MHLKSDDKHFEMRVQKTKKLLSEGSNEYLSQYPCTCDFFFFVVLDYLSLIKFGIKKINGQGGGASKGLPKVDHLCQGPDERSQSAAGARHFGIRQAMGGDECVVM